MYEKKIYIGTLYCNATQKIWTEMPFEKCHQLIHKDAQRSNDPNKLCA